VNQEVEPRQKMSLDGVDTWIENLMTLRDKVDEEGETPEVRAAVEQQIQAAFDARIDRVDSVAHARRIFVWAKQHAEEQARRYTARAARFERYVERIDAAIKWCLGRRGKRKLESIDNTLKVQANGGLQALDTSELTSAQWLNITVTLPALVWIDLLGLAQAAAPGSATYAMLTRLTEKAPRTPDTERIREALKQRIPCPECHGAGGIKDVVDCRCEGKGTIPNTVPGAKLLPRGEHVRVT
jgi:hypothetical protein